MECIFVHGGGCGSSCELWAGGAGGVNGLMVSSLSQWPSRPSHLSSSDGVQIIILLLSSSPLSSWLIFAFDQIPNRIHVHVLMSEWIRWLKATAINQEGCERNCDQDQCWKVRSSIKIGSQNRKNVSKALKLNIAQNHPVPCRGRARACQSWLREGFLSIRTSSGPRAGSSRPSSFRFLWDQNYDELKIQNKRKNQTQHVLDTMINFAKHLIMGHKAKIGKYGTKNQSRCKKMSKWGGGEVGEKGGEIEKLRSRWPKFQAGHFKGTTCPRVAGQLCGNSTTGCISFSLLLYFQRRPGF